MGTTYQDKALHWELDQWLVTNLVKCFSSTTFFGDQIVCTWDRMGIFFQLFHEMWNSQKLTDILRPSVIIKPTNKTHIFKVRWLKKVQQKVTVSPLRENVGNMSIKLSACDSWCVSSTPSVLVLSCIHESKRLVSTCFKKTHVTSYIISNSSWYEDWKLIEISDI